MESLKEITFYAEGLSEADKEHLRSVLVLAEIRLKSVWVLIEQADRSDVRLCHYGSLANAGRPVIAYFAAEDQAPAPDESGVFLLRLDINGAPVFSDLIRVLNEVDDWLAAQPKQAVAAGASSAAEEEIRQADDSSTVANVVDEAVVAEPAVEETGEIPTLMPVDDAVADDTVVDDTVIDGAVIDGAVEEAAEAFVNELTAQETEPASLSAQAPVQASGHTQEPLAVPASEVAIETETATESAIETPAPVQNEAAIASATAPDQPPVKLSWLGQIVIYLQGASSVDCCHKILLQSGQVILLDLDQNKFYSSVKIETFLDGNKYNKNSYITSMDRQSFSAELKKQDYFEGPLANLRWFLALYSNVSSLNIETEGQLYMLSEWPATDLPGLQRVHLKLAAFMRDRRASIAEISAETGIATDLIQSFVEACYYQGLLQTDRPANEPESSAPKKPKGFWGGMLSKIKW